MIFITFITFIANYYNFRSYLEAENWLLVSIAFVIGACQLWIILEGVRQFTGKAKG